MTTRDIIRQHIVDTLAGQTDANHSVYNSNPLPAVRLGSDQISEPIITVFTPRDQVLNRLSDSVPIEYEQELTIDIELAIQDISGNWAALLDRIAHQVMALMDFTLGGTVEKCYFQAFESEPVAMGNQIVGYGKLTYAAHYISQEPVLDSNNLPNFDTAHLDWDMANPNNGTVTGPDGVIDAQDHLININQDS